MTDLFEDNQRDLERAVENLGYSLEQNPDPETISKLRSDITNQAVSFRDYSAAHGSCQGIRAETARHSHG